jgi:thioredoxin 2
MEGTAMQTLNIVCPHCQAVNTVPNEVEKSEIACSACGDPLTDTTPVACDAEAFKAHIADNDIPVLVDFYSPDCGPCMEMAPDYEAAAAAFGLEVRFLKVNTLTDADLARQYNVNMLPTVIAYKNGMEINRFSSRLSKDQLGMWAESLIQMTL